MTSKSDFRIVSVEKQCLLHHLKVSPSCMIMIVLVYRTLFVKQNCGIGQLAIGRF